MQAWSLQGEIINEGTNEEIFQINQKQPNYLIKETL